MNVIEHKLIATDGVMVLRNKYPKEQLWFPFVHATFTCSDDEVPCKTPINVQRVIDLRLNDRLFHNDTAVPHIPYQMVLPFDNIRTTLYTTSDNLDECCFEKSPLGEYYRIAIGLGVVNPQLQKIIDAIVQFNDEIVWRAIPSFPLVVEYERKSDFDHVAMRLALNGFTVKYNDERSRCRVD